jgi:hypothetical protein
MMHRASVPLLFATVVACDHSSVSQGGTTPMLNWGPASTTLFSPPGDNATIAGDWFVCATADCASFLPQGFRFEASGRFEVLATTTDDAFCLKDDAGDKGTYTFDGTTITLTSDSGLSASLGFTVDGDDAKTSVMSQGGAQTIALRRRPIDRSLATCPVAIPLPATGN